MANLSITASSVGAYDHGVLEKITLPANVSTLERGDVVMIDPTTGKLVLAQGDAADNARPLGILIRKPSFAGDGVTVVRRGFVGLGDALDALDYGADVYLSGTAGKLTGLITDAAYPVRIGTVVPIPAGDTFAKALLVDCTRAQAGEVAGATITLADAGGGAQVASIQLLDDAGAPIAHAASLLAYFSDAANGLDVATTGPDSFANGTDGEALAIVAKKLMLLVSEADGDIDLSVAHAGSGEGFYLVLVLPNGKRVISDEIIPTPA